jgi:hypothetical protein
MRRALVAHPPARLAGCDGVKCRVSLVAALLLLALPVPAAGAQSGGTPVPGPGDPCPAAYPGDDASREPVARWMARGAAVRDLPQELPVMAGLAESGLRNLRAPGNSYFGFFGMHESLNAGAYRGFPRDPELQLRWFADTAVVVRQRAIAGGDADFGTDPAGYGSWIADVERPAPQNRDGYQPYLDDADALVTGSCRPADHQPDTQPPALRVRAARRQRGAVVLRVRCPAEPCMVGARAEPRRIVRAAAPVTADDETVTLTLPARRRRSGAVTATVTAVDAAGNATRRDRRITVLRP